jgi:hypothetical protein
MFSETIAEKEKLIVQLMTENKRLRAALEQIAAIPEQFGIGHWIDIAEKALSRA